ncbi:hypothetical protein MN608_09997 [Microdochium nivale]|nr:hypothetical protein MN608_09997 [Microdochium nivale]
MLVFHYSLSLSILRVPRKHNRFSNVPLPAASSMFVPVNATLAFAALKGLDEPASRREYWLSTHTVSFVCVEGDKSDIQGRYNALICSSKGSKWSSSGNCERCMEISSFKKGCDDTRVRERTRKGALLPTHAVWGGDGGRGAMLLACV